jgi:hypothetical protein
VEVVVLVEIVVLVEVVVLVEIVVLVAVVVLVELPLGQASNAAHWTLDVLQHDTCFYRGKN